MAHSLAGSSSTRLVRSRYRPWRNGVCSIETNDAGPFDTASRQLNIRNHLRALRRSADAGCRLSSTGGTRSSNPSPSSGESGANRVLVRYFATRYRGPASRWSHKGLASAMVTDHALSAFRPARQDLGSRL
jgi:hypothetical protein